MANRNPLWKYLLLFGLIVLGLIYAAPNLYGENPAIQISTKPSENKTKLAINTETIEQIKDILHTHRLPYLNIEHEQDREQDTLLLRFADTDVQLKARDEIATALGEQYVVALNLASRTPHWLRALGANPMKLGLDLRGGVHFLLDVDIDSVLKAKIEGDLRHLGEELRQANIRYTAISKTGANGVLIYLRDADNLKRALSVLPDKISDYTFKSENQNEFILKGIVEQTTLAKITDYAIEQTITTLRNRVNELGVSEASVQRQGMNHVSVDLPGIQDTTRAKDIIGKTATLRFQLVDVEHDPQAAMASGNIPVGTHLLQDENGRPVLLQDQVILKGTSVTYASFVSRDGRPAVNIHLGGGDEGLFHRITASNIGKLLAVVYVETKSERVKTLLHSDATSSSTNRRESSAGTYAGEGVSIKRHLIERVISVATIQSALGNDFDITGLPNQRYAENLALLLRSGALAAPVTIIQELTVGPSLGKANIHQGILSVEIGSLLVILFMLFYYRLFGLVADFALLLNIIFIVAILSLLGATLTLPGIAAIVLTVGMAVDANVLINERIREELRQGMSPNASIRAGYERAFSTIVDANITTLIVALILFTLGSGAVKGFAITLIIGLLSSMVTAIFCTRVIIQAIYSGHSGKPIKKLSIGI